ncbi:PhzF family phenazine biosynthesis protein [Halomicrobium sp. HM KBTZ05]|uniref:PhzF family phenazine biosynthesis protein n=1 Tax=Halomicrobium sp. HM KBTZ05 TaxID=3242663 RepID=UPI00355925AD
MDTRQALLVDAFTDEPMAGNPAGVVPDADGLDDEQFGKIASELGASETAFVLPDDEADRRLRYFTPECEVDLCGHATVAAHALLYEDDRLDAGTHTLATAAGTFEIEIDDDGTVWMEQATATVRPVDVADEDVADALGIDVATLRDVGADFPLSVASSGLPFLVVPVNYFEHLRDAQPDMAAIESLCESVGAEGLYAFTFDTLDGDATIHARAFVPLAGVPEDPVTGTAAGAACAYLRRHNALDGEREEIVVEQGHFLDRPGRVRVVTDGHDVRVGGQAVTTLDGELTVPDSEDDDIIEA